MNETGLSMEQFFWDRLDEYRQAYKDYEAMCDEQKLKHGAFPFCLCWPDDCKRDLYWTLAGFICGLIGLIGVLWQTFQNGFSEEAAPPLLIGFLLSVTVMGAIASVCCLFPARYHQERQAHYGNILYFRRRNAKDLAKLEQVLEALCAAVAPYREQKRLEEEIQRMAAAAKQQVKAQKILDHNHS